jgi:hypothetical protein
MTRDEAVREISALLKRLSKWAKAGAGPSWELEWDKLSNDIEDFVERTFGSNSKEETAIYAALNPRWVSVGTNEWENTLKNYHQPVTRALLLVQHRLAQGQARLVEAARQAQLVQPGTPHSAYVLLRDIIEEASRSILLVDPYVDRSLLPLLSNVKPSVEVRILTRHENLPADFAEELGRFRQEKGLRIEARCGLQDFHDRFLVIDGRSFFSGASFKDLGKKGSVVIELKDIADQVITALGQRWDSAKPVQR